MGFDLPVMNRLRRSGQALSPASLFSTGAQGVIYDPRDLSTMFQDSTGTTPVTAPGQPVGLRLDKSKGGPGPELVPNGSFDNPVTTGWVAQGSTTLATMSVVSGELSINTAAGNNFPGAKYDFATVVGRTYRVSLIARTSISPNGCSVYIRDSGGNYITDQPAIGTTNTAYNFVFVARQTTSNIFIFEFTGSAGTGTIFADNVSIKEIPGNHATQATSGARLTYGIEPKTGTRNLFTYSEQFDNPIWITLGVVPTADQAAGPVSGSLADRLLATSSVRAIYQNATIVIGQSYTLSVYIKRNAATNQGFLLFGDNGTPVSPDFIATDTWQRFQYTFTATVTTGLFGIADNSSSQDYDILVWGAQLELASVATPYQKVVTAFEVTEAGVPTCHYCAYAGANSMATAAIDFTATDKMSVFAGVRKLSDAATAFLAETSIDSSANIGTFQIRAPNGAAPNYLFGVRGTVAQSIGVPTTYTAPISNILSFIVDLAGDITIRVDRTITSPGNGTGGGNFGNFPLYLGRRAGTSFPFNGKDYGIVIVGKATSAAEINITEAWLAANTPTVVL